MLLGVIADDFTGAGDIANTLAKGMPDVTGQAGGLVVAQYMGVPDRQADPAIEAGVVSLKTRSIPADQAVAQSLAALKWLQAQGCRQIVFKYCSTFDSTPEGNIGPVAEALANALGVAGVIACPAFPTLGRTVHQGHLFAHDRPLNESGMQNHPLTSMRDADIRRWLGRQSKAPVGLVPAAVVRAGPEAVATALRAAATKGETLAIADAATDEDLVTLGRAAAWAPLITGGSGIAIGLPANFIRAGLEAGTATRFEGVTGPEAILAGSCSGATRDQIEVHRRDHPALAISVDDVMNGITTSHDLIGFFRQNVGKQPLAFSSGNPHEVAATQTRYGREAVAGRLDELFADTARQLVDGGVRRLVVAGGETSGAVAQALDLGDLRIGPEIDPGVPILISQKRGIALALKSGNFGRTSFFTHALDALSGSASDRRQ
ncbi:3-oxo-tetronate kinase [Paracoccus sp. PAR01]|uniref:3-oxo-tetronate kinase n=1 Tax=Paracoccus sp. PAR01 TaxID=2769282 RepID=UPI0017827393|nr:3-oxo-tetronate kinase [Paracoccus sp. PAR01]MBD9528574.1 four-carbon acid sugar kinase family protein [Paracoccus sp. PAR01]